MSTRDTLPQVEINLQHILRTVCLPKRVCIAYFTYAPLVTFILGVVTLPGHIILFPYYLLVIMSRGRPPKVLYWWVYVQSAYIYGAIHENKDYIYRDFWAMWYIYLGFIIAFIQWVMNVVSVALLFPIAIYVEEWELYTKFMYRITFGNWKRLVTECPNMRRKKEKKKEKRAAKKRRTYREAKGKKPQDVEVEFVDVKEGKNTNVCPVCGEHIDPSTTYCPKCGSYVRGN